MPDFERLAQEARRPHVTNGLLWTEYILECKSMGGKPYQISQFNELFREYQRKHDIRLRRDHEPGEVLELDWSGSALKLRDRHSDMTTDCHLFVAALPYSGYFYVEACVDETVRSWTSAIAHALSFLGGVPKILRPDNTRTATIKADRYEPVLNAAMIELAEHYRTICIPARVRKPRDKSAVEASVGFAQRNILAALRDQRFFSIDDMNSCIWERMDELNAGDFMKKPGSRLQVFNELEKPALLPLPGREFELLERTAATVAPDYHIQFDHCLYSVPPESIGNKVTVRASASTVTIYDGKGNELARHKRSPFAGAKSTSPEHIPAIHQEYLQWSGTYFRSRAGEVGPATERLVGKVLASRQSEVQSYRTCQGILAIGRRLGKSILEEAARHALDAGVTGYKGVNNIARMLAERPVPVREQVPEDSSSISALYCTHEEAAHEGE